MWSILRVTVCLTIWLCKQKSYGQRKDTMRRSNGIATARIFNDFQLLLKQKKNRAGKPGIGYTARFSVIL